MKDKDIRLILNKLNNKKLNGLIHLRRLSDTVYFAKVWMKKPSPKDEICSSDRPMKFYFISNLEGYFVAAVLDMGIDLHWYVIPKYRKLGYLTKALKSIILSNLCEADEKIRITIDEYQIGYKNFLASESVALSLGFVKGDKNQYFLDCGKYKLDNPILGYDLLIPEERLKQIQREVNYLSRSLRIIKTELEMNFGYHEIVEDLDYLYGELDKQALRIEDAWYDVKKSLDEK